MTNTATDIYYVWAAYGATAVIVTAITAWTLFNAKSQSQQLAELDARGVKRRSAAIQTVKDPV